MAVIGREAARAPLTSADINDGIVGAADLQSTLDLSSKTITMPSIASLDVTGNLTVDTSTLYVDATNNRVGIGTTSPAFALDVSGGADNVVSILRSTDNLALQSFRDDTTGSDGYVLIGANGPNMVAYTQGLERMRITSAGNVGINTDSPGGKLSVRGTSGLGISDSHLAFGANQDAYITTGASGIVVFREHDGVSTNTERMRIDSSGNLLVGKTSANSTITGVQILPEGDVGVTRDGSHALLLNRLTSDGDIALFRKDGTTVGSIGNRSTALFIDCAASTGAGLDLTQLAVLPRKDGALNNGDISLGESGYRYKDLYLTDTAYISAPSTSTAVLQLESLDTSVVAGQSIGNISWRANDASTGGTGIRGRISCEAENAGTVYALTFATGYAAAATERMRLDSSGNLLVGKATASASTGAGHILLSDGSYYSTMASSINSTSTLNVYSTGAGTYRFYVGMGGQIYATNTSITAISDASLKENVRDLDKGLDTILALKPRRFDWKNGDGNDIMGFVAQEVQETLPELIHEVKYDAETPKLGLKMGDMIPSLVKAIQEQQEIINDLRARVAQLEGA